MIAALTVPARSTAFIDPTLLESYTGEFGLLSRQLDQVIDRPIAIGIDPSIIASIRVLGTDAPASATAWLDRLDSATNETFPLAWADANLTAGLQAGSGEVLAPESFAYAIDPALFSATSDPDPVPTDAPQDNIVPPLPSDESLVAWDYTVPEISWPAFNSVTADDLTALADYRTTTILSSGNITASSASRAHSVVNDTDTVVADEALSTQFGLTVAGASGPDWELAITDLTRALGAVSSTQDSPASVLLALDREVAISDPDLGPTIDAIAAAGNVQVTGLAALLETTPVAATLVDKKLDEGVVSDVRRLLNEERADRAFAVIAADPSLISSERRLELLATISNSWSDNSTGWATAISDFSSASTALRTSVRIVKSSSITLWADRASLPVTVTNELSQPITVYVTVRPMTPLLKVEDSFVAVTVEPQSQRKAAVPVQSLSNGTVELEITLHTDTGAQVGELTYVRTTVQAGWETPVTIGFGIAVVLVFAAGIIRTILRRRRARASES